MKYELIIKEIESGEVVCREECDCVIGATSRNASEGAIVTNAFNYCSGTVVAIITAVGTAEKSTNYVKNVICEDFKKSCGDDITYEELADFVQRVSARIEVHEDVVKAIANGEVSGV